MYIYCALYFVFRTCTYTEIVCPDLEDPTYGSVDDGDNHPGTRAVYSCNDGFELVGDRKRLCDYDGTWDGEAPTCERKRL